MLNRENVERFISKYKYTIPIEDRAELRALVYAYGFAMFRCREAFEDYLRDMTKPLTDEERDKYQLLIKNGAPEDMDPFDG